MNTINLSNMNAFLGASAASNAGVTYLKFTQAGTWVDLEDADEISTTDRFLVNMDSVKHGFTGWESGKFVDAPMRSISDQPVVESSLRIIPAGDGNGWFKTLSFEAVSLIDGLKVLISLHSNGGVQAISKFIIAAAESPQFINDGKSPVITLSGDSYYHKKFQKDIYFPIITIVGWEQVQA